MSLLAHNRETLVPALDASFVAADQTAGARQTSMLVTDGSSSHGKSIIATLIAPMEGTTGMRPRSRLLALHTPKARRHVGKYLTELLEKVRVLLSLVCRWR